LLLLGGCGDRSEPRVYNIEKEEIQTAAQPAPARTTMARQSLPDGAVNRAGNPNWRVPEHWEPAAGSSMRRASFALNPAEGAIDISVTSFPGDVGGELANANRWRNQLGLPPVTEAELPQIQQPLAGSHHPANLVRIDNGETATLAATIFQQGNSWFFKMTGPSAAVGREEADFLDFVRSVDFHQH